jgi:hypothetical protein
MRKSFKVAAISTVAITSLGLAGLGVAAVSAKGGDRSKVSYVAGACSQGTATMGMLTQSGSRAQLAFGAAGPGGLGEWHVTAAVNGVPAVDVYTGSVGTEWSITQNIELPKGRVSINIVAGNGVTGETCSAGFSAKV